MSGYLIVGANGLILAIAATVIWLRGKHYLSAFFALAVAAQFGGLTYILASNEVPGFSNHLSSTYKFFELLTNFGCLAHSITVLATCWALSPTTHKQTHQPPTHRGD